jgi:hypothetical protein
LLLGDCATPIPTQIATAPKISRDDSGAIKLGVRIQLRFQLPIGKWRAETVPETHRSRTENLEIAEQRLGHASLTRGNVGGSYTPGNRTAETELAG